MTNRNTVVTIEGDAFHIDGAPTYAGRIYGGRKIEGLLLNSRMVQGIFDDLNPATRARWDYSDGPWDPDRNTDEFVAAMQDWRAAGLLGFTINLQGGSPQGYSKEQPWHNSAFTADGALREDYLARLTRILDQADDLGMVPILGFFYFGQDQRLVDEQAVVHATEAITDWLLAQGYTNVLIELGNEVDNRKYDHSILKVDRCPELMDLVKARTAGKVATPHGRLLVSTSLCGAKIPTEAIAAASDYLLLHGNGVSEPDRIREMVDITRALANYRGQPILFNEDDHFDFGADDNNMLAALDRYAGWGYFDYRMVSEDYPEGYQNVPVDWTISSDRKRDFFGLLSAVTGAQRSG